MSSLQLVLFASALVATANCACESGWREFNGNCYRFTTEKETWPAARQMCLWQQSDLIAIESTAEEKWYRQQALAFNQTIGDSGFWLGGTNFNNDGNWIWEPTNKAIINPPWGTDQPNNRNNSELCLASIKLFNYDWSDEFCNWEGALQYVCEKKESVTPIVG